MKIDNLKAFISIVEQGSFSAAAEALYTTQSTVSKKIKQLESELNTVLFNRSTRRLILTESGKILYKRAAEMVKEYNLLINELSNVSSNIRIGGIPVMSHYNILEIINGFKKAYPNKKIQLLEFENIQIEQKLAERTLDAAFMRVVTNNDLVRYRYIEICADRFVLLVPSSHPHSDKKEVSLAEFSDDKFLFLGKGTSLNEISMKMCLSAGFVPHVSYTGSTDDGIKQMVGQGDNVALLMEAVARGLVDSRIKILRFKESVETKIVFAALKEKKLNSDELTLWHYIKEYVNQK
ncbi:MAG: LysR family transcriptional regulator [Clostridiales bacterium]|nr:LysR family transcriptional regulator [Clostridiales bacterium]